jgi:hypothetical protein
MASGWVPGPTPRGVLPGRAPRGVWRSNLPPGPLTADTYAAVSLWGADERDPTMVPIDPALLGEGTNSIAVEVHNDTRRGGDLSFDAELTVTR